MGIALAIINVPSFKETLNIMLVLKFTVIYATIICVSAATNTLELRGYAVYNQSFDLVCFTAVNAPVSYAIFFRRNSSSQEFSRVAVVLYYPSLPSCNVTDSSSKNYAYSCSNGGKNITLTVPVENEAEHNTFWQCTNPGSEDEKNNNVIQVFINVNPVSKFKKDEHNTFWRCANPRSGDERNNNVIQVFFISDPVRNVAIKNSTVVSVTEGISEIAICETSPCRPSDAIYWRKNGNNITNYVAISNIQQSGTKTITTSSLLFTAVRGDNGSICSCAAYNGYGTRKLSANVIIIVRYAPDGPPSLSGYFNNSLFRMIENMSYNLVCNITGGNPLAYLSWNCFGIVGSISTVAQTVTSTISLNVERSRADPPTIETFTSPVKVIQGQPLAVVCSADGNPLPQLTWNPAGEDRVNSSRLYYSDISKDKAVNHTCTAINNMVPTIGSPQSGSDSKDLVIDVLYSPKVNPFISPVQVIQGQPLLVVCSADGNPSPQLTWNPAGEGSVNRSRLYYSTISRDKAVVHTCTARNLMVSTSGIQQSGLDSKDIFIDVLYSPDVLVDYSGSSLTNSTVLLTCMASGEPSQYTFHEWVHKVGETEIRRLTGEHIANTSILTLSKISIEDMGTYVCTVDNSITGLNGQIKQTGHTDIFVRGTPFIENTKSIFIGMINKSARIEIPCYSNPSLTTVKFYRGANSVEVTNTSDTLIFFSSFLNTLTFYGKEVLLNGQIAVLHFRTVGTTEYGEYNVVLSNDIGSTSLRIVFASGEPETPANFHVTDVQEKQVTLQWLSGDRRGFDQMFVVQFSMDNTTWTNASVINAGKKEGWFSSALTGLKSNTNYYFRLYSFNENGGGDFTDINCVTRTLKESASSLDIGASLGIGFGGICLGVVGTLSAIIIRKRITATPKYSSTSEVDISTDMETYANTSVSSSPAPSHYEDLQQDNMEKTMYDRI